MDFAARFRRRTADLLDRQAAAGTLPQGLDLGRFTAAPPSPPAPCDITVDAALVYARDAAAVGSGPLRLAHALAEDLATDPDVASAEVVEPGFVNVTLRPRAILAAVGSLLLWEGGRAASTRARTIPSGPASGDARSLDAARAAVLAEVVASLSAAAGRPVPAKAPAVRGRVRVRWRQPVRGDARDGCASTGAGAVVAEIGPDAFRFAVAARRPDATLRLDLASLAERSRANPSFWVPYAHARGRTVVRRAAAALPDLDLSPAALAGTDLSGLTDPGELALARLLVRHRHVVSDGAAAAMPHRLVSHLCMVADAVHSQWNRSKDQPQLRFVNEEQRDLTKARLGLVTASTLVLSSGLGILGVMAPDEMR